MERTALQNLIKWKDKKNRKPLIIKGARQVGKTWLMKEFGKLFFKKVVYINFENKKILQQVFLQDFNIDRILSVFSIETGIEITKNDTLIILDEIQEAERGMTSLKYFYEEAPEYYMLAAGSYLGISINQENSFPVGKVNFLDLYPLSFEEFLLATNGKKINEIITKQQWDLTKIFKSKIIERLKQYYFVGGMPEVVKIFIENNDYNEVRQIQNEILRAYEHDFSKHALLKIVPRIKMVWNSIPAQLSKENKKFIFGLIKKGARAKDFELALEWLAGSGLIQKVYRISKPGIPLKSYSDFNAFKVFLVDIGLLGAMSELDINIIIEANHIFKEFKGALTEQYVFQQLVNNDLFYWSAEKSDGEIDFILQNKQEIYPIEVKAEENLKAKSLKSFCNKYNINNAVRTSMSDYREETWLTNIPLFGIKSYFDNL
ncbi:MAG: ATPase [Candidatus Zixiibacteriota bacterium]|nr:MAG: ATPase [candidate division Zixibacteria bacterium]